MHSTADPPPARTTAGVEALLCIVQMQFAAFERLLALNFNAAKTVFEDGMAHAGTLLDATDLHDLVERNTTFAQPSLEKAIAYWRSTYDVLGQSQNEITGLLEARADTFHDEVLSLLDEVSNSLPAGSEMAMATLGPALAAAGSSYDHLDRISKQARMLAEAGFTAAIVAVRGSRANAA